MPRKASSSISFVLLRPFGIPDECVKRLRGGARAEYSPYLDLLKAKKDPTWIGPDAVVEQDERPLLYLVDRSRLAESQEAFDHQFARLRQSLASRGDRAWLAVFEPGLMRAAPVASRHPEKDEREIRINSPEAANFFPSLIFRTTGETAEPQETDYVHDYLFRLLVTAAEGVHREAPGLLREDILSLMGRALFFRFLRDRGIIQDDMAPKIARGAECLADCWKTPLAFADTSVWLDETFNGDLLPLGLHRRGKHITSRAWVTTALKGSAAKALFHLQAIVAGLEPAGDHYQAVFDEWSFYDFGHVPAGLLSQIYESFAHKWDRPNARQESVHYTPRRIAEWMAGEAFHGLTAPEKARVLDPACGAGVFLVIAMRRLYEAQWRATGKQPDTTAIRQILYSQLCGFDISESALRLAALGLYLTAIELDPDPLPAAKLRFWKPLRDTVLHSRRAKADSQTGMVSGSLGPEVGKRFARRFDLILANPPWTSVSAGLGAEFNSLCKEVLERRKLPELAARYENPDNVPDLPFLLKATEWCKPGGRIAMALHGRLFFKQERIPRTAREALFRALRITGVINGSNLTDTKVWPNMHQPFVLLFASNEVPAGDYPVQWMSPLCDPATNNNGDVIFDYSSVQPVQISEAEQEPWLWKALAVGTWLDVEVHRRLQRPGNKGLDDYWKGIFGKNSCGNGYQIKPNQPQKPAPNLARKRKLTDAREFRFVVDVRHLESFGDAPKAFRQRPAELYRHPLFLVKTFPGSDRKNGWALVCDKDVAFNESFDGYSGHGKPEGAAMVRYLQLLAHSETWVHYALMTSPKFGVERREFYKSDIESFPLTPWAGIPDGRKDELLGLADSFREDGTPDFEEVDKLIAAVHGLDQLDQEVIHDTVSLGCPYLEFRQRAAAPPSQQQRRKFCQRLRRVLFPFFEITAEQVQVELHQPSPGQYGPWDHFSVITVFTGDKPQWDNSELLGWLLKEAVARGATLIIREGARDITLCVRNQYRFWTPTRARLCAAEIVREHLGVFDV